MLGGSAEQVSVLLPQHWFLPIFDPAVKIQWITNRGIISHKKVVESPALRAPGYANMCASVLLISISSVRCCRYKAALAESGLCFCLQANTQWGGNARQGLNNLTQTYIHKCTHQHKTTLQHIIKGTLFMMVSAGLVKVLTYLTGLSQKN